jgi:hypothetical protein
MDCFDVTDGNTLYEVASTNPCRLATYCGNRQVSFMQEDCVWQSHESSCEIQVCICPITEEVQYDKLVPYLNIEINALTCEILGNCENGDVDVIESGDVLWLNTSGNAPLQAGAIPDCIYDEVCIFEDESFYLRASSIFIDDGILYNGYPSKHDDCDEPTAYLWQWTCPEYLDPETEKPPVGINEYIYYEDCGVHVSSPIIDSSIFRNHLNKNIIEKLYEIATAYDFKGVYLPKEMDINVDLEYPSDQPRIL